LLYFVNDTGVIVYDYNSFDRVVSIVF